MMMIVPLYIYISMMIMVRLFSIDDDTSVQKSMMMIIIVRLYMNQ